LRVGGDWYETVARPDGRIALAVGDVVGHGLDAAATMGRLRTAFAALAQRSDCPAEVLRQMDDFAATVPSARTSTVVCAYLHPETGVLSYASAGHPPILLVSRERGAEFLEEGRSWPLAVPVHGEERGQAHCRLDPGSALVLYSDGLVERRGESISAGLERLREATERLYGAGFHNLADVLIAELTAGESIEDDVVVVSAQRALG
jgi:serine phosphatase RsbU (regulator of sigma subunit)